MSSITLQELENSNFTIDPEFGIALDGGTITFHLKIGNNTYTLFLDRRLKTTTPNELYLNSYPDREGSILLGKSNKIQTALEELINSTNKQPQNQ